MKYFIVLIIVSILFSSCSKQEDCYCNTGNGEYEYLPPSNQIHDPSSSVNTFGDLEQECTLQDRYLKESSSPSAYCEMK